MIEHEHHLLTVDEARAILRVGRAALYEAIRTGKVPHIRIGHQYRIPRARLMEMIESVAPKD